MTAWVNLLKNNSFAEISQISYVDSRHLLKRSTTQFYPFLETQVKLMGNHPRVQVCWTLEKTTHCFKKQRDTGKLVEKSRRLAYSYP